MTQVLALLKNYKNKGGNTSNNNNSKNNKGEIPGLAFVQSGNAVAWDRSKYHCFICGKVRHHGHDCRSVTPDVRDRHMARRKKELYEKLPAQTPRA